MKEEEIYINIMKENWLHARHIETERMWFANIYAVIIVAVTAYVAQHGIGYFSIATLKIIVIVLLLISLIWFFITLKLNFAFKNHMDAIKKIFDDKKIPLGNDWKLYTGLPHSYSVIDYKLLFTIAFLLLAFYALAIGGLIYAIVCLCQGKLPLT
ncbi:MAG: hypothetical protein KAW90_00360 [Dehalococcoidales bacterium]|nr:hypothetical protein [Dehalococcoidales bacterium]